ncbi:MAG: hypothetical protein ABEH66_05330 [Halobacteriales archaeon]
MSDPEEDSLVERLDSAVTRRSLMESTVVGLLMDHAGEDDGGVSLLSLGTTLASSVDRGSRDAVTSSSTGYGTGGYGLGGYGGADDAG